MSTPLRLILAVTLFASVAVTCYSIGFLFTGQEALYRWPASGQVAFVLCSTVGTAILWALLGIGHDAEPWDQFDQFEDRR